MSAKTTDPIELLLSIFIIYYRIQRLAKYSCLVNLDSRICSMLNTNQLLESNSKRLSQKLRLDMTA
jgi:hypothetical protein